MTLPFISGTVTGPGATDALFVIIDAQLLAQGWTLIDTISNVVGNRSKVYKGTPLDSTAGNAPYLQVIASTTTSINWIAFTDWDTSTHTGICPAGASGNTGVTTQDASFAYWMRVNPVSIAITTKTGSSSYNKSYAGFMRRHMVDVKSGVTKSSGSITAGATTVSVASDMTGKLFPGQWVHIVNYAHSSASANKLHKELIQISTISSGSITFATAVLKNYDAGALIGYNPLPNVCGSSTTSTGQPASSLFVNFILDGSDLLVNGGTSYSPQINSVFDSTGSPVTPESPTSEYVCGYFVLISSSLGGTAGNGFLGSLYSWECTIGNTQGAEDTMDDKIYQFQLFNTSTSTLVMMGPINV